MPSAVAGNLVFDAWTVRDPAGVPLTGQTVPADVTLTLYRQSGAALIAASETIAWTEVGATGTYYFAYTPQSTGLYLLILDEIDAGTAQRRGVEFRVDVLSAGAVSAPSYADAFCAETDIERWLQQAITVTSQPNDTEAAGFAVGRAGVLQSLCARFGRTTTPTDASIVGTRLSTLLREANAIGAALDYTIAQTFRTSASRTERIITLIASWSSYCGSNWEHPNPDAKAIGYIEQEIRGNLASLATSHTISGDTTPRADENAPRDVGFQVRMGDLY